MHWLSPLLSIPGQGDSDVDGDSESDVNGDSDVDGEGDYNSDSDDDGKCSNKFQPWTCRRRPSPRGSQIRSPWVDSSDLFDPDLAFNQTYKSILSNLAMSRT